MRWIALAAIALLALPSCATRKASTSEAAGPVAEQSGTAEPPSSGVAPEAPAAAADAGASAASAGPAAAAATGLRVRPVTASQVLGLARQPGPRAVMVNVWATWCGPCRAEFPDLIRLYHNYRGRGVKLMLVSADFDDQLPAVKRFLAKNGVDFECYIKNGDDMQFIDGMDPRWTGSIPATFIYDRQGRLVHFHEGMSTYDEFEQDLLEVLGHDHADSLKGNRS